MYIEKSDTVNSLRRYSIIGTRIPLYCTALGKSLIFEKSEKELKDLFQSIELKSFTDKTLNNVNELIENIQRAKVNGYSSDIEEHNMGVCCVGAPIYDYRNQITAAISISSKKEDFDEMDKDSLIEALVTSAKNISKRIGNVR